MSRFFRKFKKEGALTEAPEDKVPEPMPGPAPPVPPPGELGEGNPLGGVFQPEPEDENLEKTDSLERKSVNPSTDKLAPTDSDNDSEDSASEEDERILPTEGAYDPKDFEALDVTPEIRDLFQFITQYRPQELELETKLKPFIPEFIPAVGDIDAFIKIPRPDALDDNLGLAVLDEPSGTQSDPTVLSLQLRAQAKQGSSKGTVAKRLERADRNPGEIDSWIRSISDLHRSKPATHVHYSKPMPDIDTLMQEWPAEIEDMLKTTDLAGADMTLSLEDYAELICNMTDIPVYKGKRIQSLHLFFSLYSEFKNSQHFKTINDEPGDENLSGEASGNDERLVL